MRLVLDTNVWLDWLVFDDPSVAPLKAAVAAQRAEIFIDAACEAELERVLACDLGKHSLDAAAARADFLVTKDRARLELARRSRSIPFRIATPDAAD